GRARSGLENVDRKLVVELAVGDPVGRLRDALGEFWFELSEVCVDAGRRRLDATEPADNHGRDRLAGDREVVDRLGRLATPKLITFSNAHGFLNATNPRKRSTRAQRPP